MDLDLSHPEQAAAVHRLVTATEVERHPGDVPRPFEFFAKEVAHPRPLTETYWFGAEDQDMLAAVAQLEIDHGDATPDLALVDVHVDPQARGRGLTRAVVAPLAARALGLGRTRLVGDALEGSAGAAWCQYVGAQLGLVARYSRLDLKAVDWDRMTRWATPSAGYDLVFWEGPCPIDLLERFTTLKDVQNTAPFEGIALVDTIHRPEDVAEVEAARVAKGEAWWTFAARHEESGALVGYTVVFACPWDPALWWQGWTVVDGDHRRRGLARWMKAAMALRLVEQHQEALTVETDNAASNEGMLAINIEMGFAPSMTMEAYQIDSAALAEWAQRS